MKGVAEGAQRFIAHDYDMREAFDSLELGFDSGEAERYLKAMPTWKEIVGSNPYLGQKFLGTVLAFGAACVEAERLKDSDE